MSKRTILEQVEICRGLRLSTEDTLATLDGAAIGLATLEGGETIVLDIFEKYVSKNIKGTREKIVEITDLDIFESKESLSNFLQKNTKLRIASLKIDLANV